MAETSPYSYENGIKVVPIRISPSQYTSPNHTDITHSPLKGLIAVIPTYNDEITIGSVVVQAMQYVDRVIVVDDNSTDKTPEIARLAGADVMQLHIHTGKAYALLLGLRSAREQDCKAVVTLDADGQQHIHDIPKIAARVISGDADLIIGSRFLEKSTTTPFSKQFQSVYFRNSNKFGSGKTFTDLQSKFRAMSSKALENLDFNTDGFNIQSDIITHFLGKGLIVDEVQLTNLFIQPSDAEWGNPIKVLAAMPAYNEEKYIAKTIVGARKYVDKVLVVDDGSTDTTKEIAEGLGALVVKHEINSGYGAALRSIFNKARELHVDALVILDADGQHNPVDIGKVLDALVQCDVDVVIGSRFIDGSDKQIPGYRKVGMKVLDGATRIAGVAEISDSQSGFRAYGKRAIDVIKLKGEGMSAGSEILIQISDHNLKIAEVPINVRYDIEDTSTIHPVRHGMSVLSKIIGLITYRKPLLAFGIPGLALILGGMIAELWVFAELRVNSVFHDVLAIGSAFILVLGMLLLIAGIILNSLVRIVNECK
ncbi:glycosyltransferase family 2 protein [uncultured Methanoregula sp.]|uniref:glycosyltransferase family 2 protein n=1 Tax=uncultured Methanoregula sp. TaxID=1005933 RepID=UPI002AAB4889|nr:glycosyltransferase family 2 protein [uncultured Methanoregula sp.]